MWCTLRDSGMHCTVLLLGMDVKGPVMGTFLFISKMISDF